MKTTLLRMLVCLGATVASLPTAHARIIEIDGSHLRFFYDTSYWGSKAVVSGDAIQFVVPAGTARGKLTGKGSSAGSSNAGAVLTVVGKNGYDVRLGVTSTYGGTYTLSTGASGKSVDLSGYGSLTGGHYADGTFVATGNAFAYGSKDQLFRNPAGKISHTDSVFAPPGQHFQALEVDVSLLSKLISTSATGSIAGGIDSFAYSFNVSPVPEPDAAAMLLAGIATVGMLAGRRKKPQ